MFKTIKRINKNGELKDNLVNVDDISLVIELTQDDVDLYDENGEFVETKKPTEKLYKVFIKGGQTLKINEETYNTLVKALVK